MARFDWTARDRSGRSVNGTLDATSKEDVISRLQAQGLIVMTVDGGGAASSGPIDFAARLDAHSTGAVDYATRLQPKAPRRRPGLAIVVALVFGGVGAALLRVAGWPVPLVPGIVAAVFLLLAAAMILMVIVGLMMPARAAAAAEVLKRRAETARRNQ
jgi:CHASE2 domain-containing sensor protein